MLDCIIGFTELKYQNPEKHPNTAHIERSCAVSQLSKNKNKNMPRVIDNESM